jgi:hypothetical protein
MVKLGKYKHYKSKDKFYVVTGIGVNSETLEEYVIYKAMYSSERFAFGTVWLRPKKEFLGRVSIEGQLVNRFEFVGEEKAI